MRITVFGANGKVGRLVVRKLLENGHFVRAFVYGPNPFEETSGLQVIKGNVEDKAAVFNAVAGSEVIISTLGSWGTKNKNILSVGMSNILPAAEKHGISKVISLTGTDAVAPDEKIDLLRRFTRVILKLIAKKILLDGENHMALLQNNDIDWTVVRAPIMNDRGVQDNYTLSIKPPHPWQTVSRDDVAKAIVDLVTINDWTNQAPFIRRL